MQPIKVYVSISFKWGMGTAVHLHTKIENMVALFSRMKNCKFNPVDGLNSADSKLRRTPGEINVISDYCSHSHRDAIGILIKG